MRSLKEILHHDCETKSGAASKPPQIGARYRTAREKAAGVTQYFPSLTTQPSEERTALSVQSRTLFQVQREYALTIIGVEGETSAQTFTSMPHASSNRCGTYLLSLCFCAHSLNGIEF
jgi:hypothetical protein